MNTLLVCLALAGLSRGGDDAMSKALRLAEAEVRSDCRRAYEDLAYAANVVDAHIFRSGWYQPCRWPNRCG